MEEEVQRKLQRLAEAIANEGSGQPARVFSPFLVAVEALLACGADLAHAHGTSSTSSAQRGIDIWLHVVERLKGLSVKEQAAISAVLQSKRGRSSSHVSTPFRSGASRRSETASSASSNAASSPQSIAKSSAVAESHANSLMREWFVQHMARPFPSKAEKAKLLERAAAVTPKGQAPLSVSSLGLFFINTRRRSGWTDFYRKYAGESKDTMARIIACLQEQPTSAGDAKLQKVLTEVSNGQAARKKPRKNSAATSRAVPKVSLTTATEDGDAGEETSPDAAACRAEYEAIVDAVAVRNPDRVGAWVEQAELAAEAVRAGKPIPAHLMTVEPAGRSSPHPSSTRSASGRQNGGKGKKRAYSPADDDGDSGSESASSESEEDDGGELSDGSSPAAASASHTDERQHRRASTDTYTGANRISARFASLTPTLLTPVFAFAPGHPRGGLQLPGSLGAARGPTPPPPAPAPAPSVQLHSSLPTATRMQSDLIDQGSVSIVANKGNRRSEPVVRSQSQDSTRGSLTGVPAMASSAPVPHSPNGMLPASASLQLGYGTGTDPSAYEASGLAAAAAASPTLRVHHKYRSQARTRSPTHSPIPSPTSGAPASLVLPARSQRAQVASGASALMTSYFDLVPDAATAQYDFAGAAAPTAPLVPATASPSSRFAALMQQQNSRSTPGSEGPGGAPAAAVQHPHHHQHEHHHGAPGHSPHATTPGLWHPYGGAFSPSTPMAHVLGGDALSAPSLLYGMPFGPSHGGGAE